MYNIRRRRELSSHIGALAPKKERITKWGHISHVRFARATAGSTGADRRAYARAAIG